MNEESLPIIDSTATTDIPTAEPITTIEPITADYSEILEALERISGLLENLQTISADIVSLLADTSMFAVGVVVGGLALKTFFEVGTRW